MAKSRASIILFLVFIASLSVLYGCNKSPKEGFAIYLTKDDIPPLNMEALSHVEKASLPLLSEEDIVTYYAKDHSILLTPSAMNKLMALQLTTRGKSFLVCVDGQPVYWGAFWTPLSSMSFEGVVIMLPSASQKDNMVEISLGYPGESFYKGSDPRNDKKILDSLESHGKLSLTP